MIFYHGSKEFYDVLKPQQAEAGEDADVHEDELKNAIYLTPFREFAIFNGAKPNGLSYVHDGDGEKRSEDGKIKVDCDRDFYESERSIYVYKIDSENVPPENLVRVRVKGGEYDEGQYAVIGMDELKYDEYEEMKASEVEKYYELLDWTKESREKFKKEQEELREMEQEQEGGRESEAEVIESRMRIK